MVKVAKYWLEAETSCLFTSSGGPMARPPAGSKHVPSLQGNGLLGVTKADTANRKLVSSSSLGIVIVKFSC